MEGTPLLRERRVLIVDRSEETREVLETALRRRGVTTFSTGRVRQGLELARRIRPELIVLDLEVDDSDPESVWPPYAEQSRADRSSLVLLGSIRCGATPPLGGDFVHKPYHYAPLIRRIEGLLEDRTK